MELTFISHQSDLADLLMPLFNSKDVSLSCLTHIDELKSADLVIYAPDHFTEKDLNTFLAHPMADEAEWILVSDGEPNRYLDKLMTSGVSYHFREPLDPQHIYDVIKEFQHEFELESSVKSAKPITSSLDQFGLLLGSAPVMRRLYRLIRRVSQTDANVMLIGDSGTGKELAARTIHEQSLRADKPFIAINSAALTPELVESELFGHVKGAFTGAVSDREGCFEQGNGGTLFLDEITEMPLELQSKLLRVLESGEFKRVGSETVQKTNVRIIAATNRSPMNAIEDGFLREDIYFRLAHFPIQLPLLRKRGQDIVELAQHFLAYRNQRTATSKMLSDEAKTILLEYSWPGNVRELKHCIEKAHILAADIIGATELASLVDKSSDELSLDDIKPGTSLKDAEKALVLATLEAFDGNKTQAAEQLGVSIKTLYNKLEQYQDT